MDERELERLAAALRGRYILEGVAGRGTSATVFRAADLRHDRQVAVKVLDATVSTALGAERFHREIRTAARLQHPHILPLFDSGDAAGRLYYTMPYVESGTLRDRLNRDGPLSVTEALRIGRETAEALAYAHASGVVHRDIKPENIALSPAGHAMLADFGVARATGGTAASVTAEGLAVGTPAYMSPEQVTGQEPIDGRADVYALGAVLYEALTGSPPFPGSDVETVMRRRLVESPPSARLNRREVPVALDGVLRKAMARREERYQSAADLLAALKQPGSPTAGAIRPGWRRAMIAGLALLALAALGIAGRRLLSRIDPPGKDIRMLVVLPFKNLGQPGDQYFADGLTEEIRSRLAGLSSLRVISRTSAEQYRNSGKSLKQIGAELGANYVLEGSVRWDRSGGGRGRIRVTPQLIRVADDSHLWAERYDAELTRVLQIQSDIAERLTAALGVTLRDPERAGLVAGRTSDPAAYDLYLRGNEYFDRGFGRASLLAALELYQKAVARDPRFAVALARLSRAHTALYWFGHDKAPARLAYARAMADSALRVAPNLAEGRLALGFYYYGARDYQRALEQFRAARRTQPSNSELLGAIARVERRQGHWDAGLAGFEEAVRYDPRSSVWLFDLAATYFMVFRYPDAERAFDRAITLAPDWANPHVAKAHLYLAWHGDLAQATATLGSALTKVAAGALAPVLISYDVLSGTPFTSESLFAPALDGLTLQSFDGDSVRYYLLKAEANRFRGRTVVERIYADSARVTVEKWARVAPGDVRLLADLSLAYAALGRREDAIRTARRASDLVPPATDAILGRLLQARLARVHMMLGEPDHAVAQLKPLIAVPGGLSPAELAADPLWVPLRSHPGFLRLAPALPPRPGS